MNQTFVCNYCNQEIDNISRITHVIVCNQHNAVRFFCNKCQLYFNRNEETDHLISHQLEEYSNLSSSNNAFHSVPNSNNNYNTFSYINQSEMNNNNNNDVQMEYNQPNEATEFFIKDLEKMPNENKHCVICLVEYVINDKVKILPCIHIFHSKCIDQWLLKKPKCPLCKTKVNTHNMVIDYENNNPNNHNAYDNNNNGDILDDSYSVSGSIYDDNVDDDNSLSIYFENEEEDD